MKKNKISKSEKKEVRAKKKEKAETGKLRTKIKMIYFKSKERLTKGYGRIRSQIKASIRLEILFIVGVSLALSSIVGVITKNMSTSAGIGQYSYMNYEESIQYLQDRLISAVQEITGVEQIVVGFNINTEELRRIVSTTTLEEGVYQLQHQLVEMYEVKTIGDRNYGSYDFLADEVSTSEYEKLYRELEQLIKGVK